MVVTTAQQFCLVALVVTRSFPSSLFKEVGKFCHLAKFEKDDVFWFVDLKMFAIGKIGI